MKHPRLCPWVELSEDADGLHLTDTKQGKRYHVDSRFRALLLGLDGQRDPRAIDPSLSREDAAVLMKQLKEHKLVRQKATLSASGLSVYLTFPLAHPSRLGRLRAGFFNNVLLKMWLPTLVLGIMQFWTALPYLPDGGELAGAIIGFAIGMVLHELAHACACTAYGGDVYGCGIMLFALMPGAFVELDVDAVKHPLRRAQIFAAGVEMNLYLTGLLLLLTGALPPLATPCFSAALANGILALLNLTLTFGLDGLHILSSLLDVDDLCGMAIEILFSRQNRRHLHRKGVSGNAALAFCGMGLAMQLFFPLLIAVNLSEVILWVL